MLENIPDRRKNNLPEAVNLSSENIADQSTNEVKFDVYGRILLVIRKEGEWTVLEAGVEGKRREAVDIFIPSEVEEEELDVYLSDIYHENATPEKPMAVRIDTY